jgi:hypothetical protein
MCTSNLLRDLLGEPARYAGTRAKGDQHKAAPEGGGRGILQAIAWAFKKF